MYSSFTALCVTFQEISGIEQVRGCFSVDRRSPSMLLYGRLSLFRTNFAGCYVSCCDVLLASPIMIPTRIEFAQLIPLVRI